jgi:putative NADPH-quinone reductase
MNFDPILHEGYRREQALEPDLAAARAAFAACAPMVVVFPLWCGDMPALMKGFFERVLQPDLLKFETSGGRDKVTLYRGKSARIIMTMGMPGWFYRWYFGAYALKLITRNILKFIGIKPVRSTVYGMVETVSVDTRRQWLREVEALGHMAS